MLVRSLGIRGLWGRAGTCRYPVSKGEGNQINKRKHNVRVKCS